MLSTDRPLLPVNVETDGGDVVVRYVSRDDYGRASQADSRHSVTLRDSDDVVVGCRPRMTVEPVIAHEPIPGAVHRGHARTTVRLVAAHGATDRDYVLAAHWWARESDERLFGSYVAHRDDDIVTVYLLTD